MMSRKSGIKWMTLMALPLLMGAAPRPTFADDTVNADQAQQEDSGSEEANEDSPAFDLKLEQVRLAVSGLHVEVLRAVQGNESSPVQGVKLRGMIYQRCADHFTVSNTLEDGSVATNDGIGFKITDDGQGLDCVKKANADKKKGQRLKMVPISSHFPSAKLDLSGYPNDGRVGLIYTPKDQDVDGGLFADLDPSAPISYQSPATLKRIAAERAAEIKAARIEANQDAFKNCRNDNDELNQAYKAIRQLKLDLGKSYDYAEAKEELDKARKAVAIKEKKKEIKEFRKRIAKVKSPEEALELSDEITEFGEDNEDYAETSADLQMQLARHLANDLPDADQATYSAAQQIAQNATNTDGVSSQSAGKYRAEGRSFQIGGMKAAAQAGTLDISTATPAFYGLAKDVASDQQALCRVTAKQSSISPACAQALLNTRALPEIQQAFQQSWINQQTSAMQWMQSMYGMNNSSLGAMPQARTF